MIQPKSEKMVRQKQQYVCMTVLILVILGAYSVNSEAMPPRLYSPPELVKTNTTEEHDEPPYELTVNEDTVDIGTLSSSYFIVNLNRAAPTDIYVNITVFSGPDLITFDNKTQEGGNGTSVDLVIIYKLNTFGDRVINFHSGQLAGHAEIVCKIQNQPNDTKIDDSSAYVSVNIGKSSAIGVLIIIVGWIYFAAWSLSFYPQVILNYTRKSVVGLNFDFLALNLFGFACYGLYNFSMMFSRDVQKEYYERNSYSRIPVETNDLFFAVHALTLTVVTVVQCFIYERGDQKVTMPCAFFIGLASVTGMSFYVVNIFKQMLILDVLLYFSYVKLTVTLIKYTPQAYMNYQRQATTGWSIHNILLDFTGGVFSIMQMFLIAYNYDDWVSIFGNFTKFGLGFISIAFDILFVIQHYVLYNKQSSENMENSDDSVPSPVISQSVRSIAADQ